MHRLIAALALFLFGLSSMAETPPANALWVTQADYRTLYELMDFLRKENKQALFVPVAKLQLSELLQSAEYLEASEPDHATETRRFARGVAFNIASFTWPGWGDEPEPIPAIRQQEGLAAAHKGLEIAEQIDDVTPNILWILGMHQINAGLYDEAIASLERAKGLARDDSFRLMHGAWQQFARVVEAKGQSGVQELDQLIEKLRNEDMEDAAFYADQLVTAKGVYLPDRAETGSTTTP